MAGHTFAQILSAVNTFAKSANDLASLQDFIVEIIPQRLPHYNVSSGAK
jgi:L-methionine (R)-S-oxide reductase